MLGLAGLLAIFAVFLVRNYVANQSQPIEVTEQTIPTTRIAVATTMLVFGNRLGSEHVRLIDWPTSSMPPGAFTDLEELVGKDKQRVVLRTIEVGEPILPSKITGFGERAVLSSVMEEAMRAVTIRVNDVAGVAGFVFPGDKVDILITREEEGGGPITDVLLQNIKVLGIDQKSEETQDKPAVAKAVTVEVTPVQAQKLALAQQVGQLSLSLRHMSNLGEAPTPTITVADLKDGEMNVTPEPAPPPAEVKTQSNGSADHSDLVPVTIIRGLTPMVESVPVENGVHP